MTVPAFDTAVLAALVPFQTEGLADAFIAITELGSTTVIGGLALATAIYLLSRQRYALLTGLIIALGGSTAAVVLLKEAIDRARPPFEYAVYIETSSSFPSGHATLSLAFYGFLAFLAWEARTSRTRSIALALTALIIPLVGFSRLFLGVHYPSDVAAGYLVGSMFLAIAILTVRRFRRDITPAIQGAS